MVREFKSMPRGIFPLCFLKVLSTFTYAIFFSSLSLYLTHQLSYPVLLSNKLVALFLTFNFIVQLIGGLMGGGTLSYRYLFLSSSIVGVIGTALMAKGDALFLGLSTFLIGNGFSGACFNCMMTSLFSRDDPKRETGFFFIYSAMNLGFMLGFFVSGFFDFTDDYYILFEVAFFINVLKVVLILFCWSSFKKENEKKSVKRKKTASFQINVWGLMSVMTVLVMLGFQFPSQSHYLSLSLGVATFFHLILLMTKQSDQKEKKNMLLYLILMISSLLFWMVYYTGPMGVTLFIKQNVDKQLFGFRIATQWLFNMNAFVIMIGGPVLAALFGRLRERGLQFSISTQFVVGLFFLSLSFFVLAWGIYAANAEGYSNITFSILHFILQSVGELFVVPVGYAMVGQLAPSSLRGYMMGVWMMMSGLGVLCSHYFSNAMMIVVNTNPLQTNQNYLYVFNQLGMVALLGAILLYVIQKWYAIARQYNVFSSI